MDIGKQIVNIRKAQQLTQEEFGSLFHVTRQTVSNWENRKSFPDLETLVEMSNRFDVSLDTLLKGDSAMIKEMDKARVLGEVKHEQTLTDFFTGAGTGIVVSCLFSPSSTIRTVVIFISLAMIGTGWFRKARYDKKVLQYFNAHERK